MNNFLYIHLFFRGRFGLRLDNPLDDFLFFDQESADDAIPHAFGASTATVSPLHRLLASGNLSVLARPKGGNPREPSPTVAAARTFRGFLFVKPSEFATRSLDHPHSIGLGVVAQPASVG